MNLRSPWALFQAWCLVAPFFMVQAIPRPDPNLTPDPSMDPDPDPAINAQFAPPPNGMGWLGAIGGLLGVVSYTQGLITDLAKAFTPVLHNPNNENPIKVKFHKILKDYEKEHSGETIEVPEKKGDAPWAVAIQVGLDGTGLKGAGGDFPQICLWNIHGQLLGYNDQTMRIADTGHPLKLQAWSHMHNLEWGREGTPTISNGALQALGIWPAPGKEDLKNQQAAYVTMIKRHFDAICVAAVHVKWPDDISWVFDGSWGRASNMSWYFSFVYTSDARQRECFWLDHRGDLRHTQDLEEEYLGASIGALSKSVKSWYPDYFWAKNVVPETGIPEGDLLTEGMRENGVDDYKVPLGVKWHLPSFVPQNYGKDFDNLTVEDFVTNPGKMEWITKPMHRNVRGGNPVLPILHPITNISDKNPELVWEDELKQKIPDDCLTDWYYDEEDNIVEPGSGRRCKFINPYENDYMEGCRDNWKPNKNPRGLDGPGSKLPTPSLQERHARTLVNDQNKRGGSGTAELCKDPHSVGPNYANHDERVFCRMTDRTLWPFCDSAAGVTRECFDPEAEVLVEKSGPVGKRSTYWDAIEDWHSGSRFKRAA